MKDVSDDDDDDDKRSCFGYTYEGRECGGERWVVRTREIQMRETIDVGQGNEGDQDRVRHKKKKHTNTRMQHTK
jgi:hypothetical protein